jgi:hypothetical protein
VTKRRRDVRPLIDAYLGSLPDLDVYVYEPQAADVENQFDDKKEGSKPMGSKSNTVAALPFELQTEL